MPTISRLLDMSGKRMFFGREARRDRKEKRLRAKVAKAERERDALEERCRILEEENRFCGTVLARMRLHARAEVAQFQRQLLKLGIGSEQEESTK
jgi:hypothetical protein